MIEKKEFQAESKKLLEMMINSIYTHKEIFLRELISNASDALDKLYIRSLEENSGLSRDSLEIKIIPDETANTLKISDNGIGMTLQELETNLGTIAKSGSLDFKNQNTIEDASIIGQFGIGFYSSFMVAKKVEVRTRAYGSDTAYLWESEGVEGYTISPCEKDDIGTEITLFIKDNVQVDDDDDEDKVSHEDYSEYLASWKIRTLVKKYSDYIRYPIKAYLKIHVPPKKEGDAATSKLEWETINTRIPIWKKSKSEITDDEYNDFYKSKFSDYQNPLIKIHTHSESTSLSYDSLLFIPENPPYNFNSKNYEKGIQLYSSGVLIVDKAKELVPDYFGFVKGLADSSDISLNISREMLQQDHQLKIMARGLERTIKNELKKILANDREKYEKFWKSFGIQIKFGIYEQFGSKKELLKDLLMYKSSYTENSKNESTKYTTIDEYLERKKDDQEQIFYASGSSISKIESLPQVEAAIEKGFEVLYLTDNVDEFSLQMLVDYNGVQFLSVQSADFSSATEEEKEKIKSENENAKDMFKIMKKALSSDVTLVRYSSNLKSHPVCISGSGDITAQMEKILSMNPGSTEGVPKADKILEINPNHKIADKLRFLYDNDKKLLKSYTKILYQSALLIEGIIPENPAEFVDQTISALV